MENHEAWADGVIVKIREKMTWVSEKNKDKIPYTTDADGNYDDRSDLSKEWRIDDGINWWTNGFCGKGSLQSAGVFSDENRVGQKLHVRFSHMDSRAGSTPAKWREGQLKLTFF